MIHFGLVGIGGFAQTYLRALRKLAEEGVADLAAVVVRHPDKYKETVGRLERRGSVVYPTLEALLREAHGLIDVLGIPTGIASHAPLAIEAMAAGLPVLVEKPLAATVQEADALSVAERRSQTWCAVGYQWIHSPATQWLRQQIADGRVGRVREGRCVIGWPRDWQYYTRNSWAGKLRTESGWVLDGPATNATAHYLTNMLYLTRAQTGGIPDIQAVRAELYRANPIQSYDTSCIQITMSDGCELFHYASHALHETIDPQMVLYGEKGSIEWNASSDRARMALANGKTQSFQSPDPDRNHLRPIEQAARVAAGLDDRPLCGLAEATPHVLAIDLAFESSGGVHSIPPNVIATKENNGRPLVTVHRMAATLNEAMQKGGLFSDLEVPWAQHTVPYSASGYVAFPQGDALRAFLRQHTEFGT